MLDGKIGSHSANIAHQTYTEDHPWWHVVMRVIAVAMMFIGGFMFIGLAEPSLEATVKDFVVHGLTSILLISGGYFVWRACGGRCLIDPEE